MRTKMAKKKKKRVGSWQKEFHGEPTVPKGQKKLGG